MMSWSVRQTVKGITVLVASLIIGVGCGDNDPVGPVPLRSPSDPYPTDQATDVPLIPTLAWSFVYTSSDSVFFDLYLGTDNPPPLFDSRLTDTLYTPGPLSPDTRYYWKVIAHNDTGYYDKPDSVSSPIWSFTTSSSFVLPLAIGNRWDYSRTFYACNFDPDSLADLYGDTIYGSSTTEITGLDTLYDSLETYMFHTSWIENGSGNDFVVYRNNITDGLYSYAYEQGFWVGPPTVKLSEGMYLEFMGFRFRSFDELRNTFYSRLDVPMSRSLDTIIYEEPPVRELAYPLEIGQRWVYRDMDNGDPMDMEKEVVDYLNVGSPADEFECFKVRWFWDINDDGEWDTGIDGYDYLSAVGYVEREFRFYDIIVTGVMGDTLGTFDWVDEYVLTEYQLE